MTPQQLKKARKRLGHTFDSMAEALDIGRRTYAYREAGKEPISKTMAMAIYWLLFLQMTGANAVIKKIHNWLK